MYNEIEELEKKMTRKPAGQLDPLFDLPSSTKWDDPATVGLRNPSSKQDTMVGAVAPDYSGYDDLEEKIKGLKPRDTSKMDLLSMGLSTAIGSMFGQTGVAAKKAGDFGMERFNKSEKRDDDLEKQLLAIQLARANKQASGKKGQKVSSGGGNAEDPTKNRFLGEDGYLHTPTMKRPDGTWAQLQTDPVYDKPSAQIRTVDESDGSTRNILIDKNRGTSIGSKNAESKLVKNAKGEMVPINTRTVADKGLPENFNSTQMALSPSAQKKYDDVSRRQASDGYLARYQTAASDLRAASAALGSDGELSPGFLLASQRFLGMGMDKGRSLTNDEFAKVEGVNTGLVDKFKNKLIGWKEGKVSSDEVRQEYRKLTALLSTNVEQLRNERINGYNTELKKGLGDEFRPELGFGNVSGISAKQQESDVNKVDKLSNDLKSDKPVIKINPADGRKVKMVFNPKTKKFEYAGEVDGR
jgi:hypothetical protein